MFLNELEPLDTIVVELVDPRTGDPLFDKDDEKAKGRKPLTVTVRSKQSEEAKLIERKRVVKNTNRNFKAKSKGGKNKDLEITVADAERSEEEMLDELVELTVGVYLLESEDKLVELSDMKRVYKKWPWVRAQVYGAFLDEGKLYRK